MTALGLTAFCCAPNAKETVGDGKPLRYIVTFPEAGILHYEGDAPGLKATAPEKNGQKKFHVHSPQVESYRSYLSKLRDRHVEKIEALLGHTLDIRQTYDLIVSGVATDLTAKEAAAITDWLGFAAEADVSYALDTFRGPAFIGAGSVWDGDANPDRMPHTGIGVTIGVLDTGYKPAHPSFGVMSPSCNGDRFGPFQKVLSAVDCTGRGCREAIDGGDPSDHIGHGSHTAGIAAGNVLEDMEGTWAPTLPSGFSRMSGVAPCANLRIYKVCDDGGCSRSYILAGQEAAISDAIDVLSFSIVSSAPWEGTELGFLDAVNAGIVVAASAGNTTPSRPNPAAATAHLGPWVLSVAASSHDHTLVVPGHLSATGPGTPPANTQNITLIPSDATATVPAQSVGLRYAAPNSLVCAFTHSGPIGYPEYYFESSIALFENANDCSLEVRIRAARDARAVAVVLFNNTGSESDNHPVGISLEGETSPIPVYSIARNDAEALISYLGSRRNLVVNFEPATAQGDVLADYSLRGPNLDFDVTKPDIAAPGTQIYAAYIAPSDSYRPIPSEPALGDPFAPTNYAYLSGTSMAAPYVAGAAALVREAHPDWSATEVASALRLTAVDGRKEGGVTPWTPDDAGNGRVNLLQANLAGLVMDETYAHFRDANPAIGGDPKTLNLPAVRNTNCNLACSWSRELKNGLATSSTWIVTAYDNAEFTVSVSPMSFTLAPRGSLGDTQTLSIVARQRSTSSGFEGNIRYSHIELRNAADPGMPPERITVAVRSNR